LAGRAIVGVSMVFGSGIGARLGKAPIDDLARPRRPSRVVSTIRSAAMSASGLTSDDVADALDDRAQRDDRGDADGDANEKEEQRCHDARVSRAAMRRTNLMAGPPTLVGQGPSKLGPYTFGYSLHDAAVAEQQPRVGQRRELRVVRDEDDRAARER